MRDRYLLDSDIVIVGFNIYPPDIFPKYWQMLQDLQASQSLFICEAVENELNGRGDEASSWMERTFPKDAILSVSQETLSCYAKTIQWASARTNPPFNPDAFKEFADESKADAWLVAHAMEHGLTILSNETSSPQKSTKVKIPDAAHAQGVECITMLELIRKQSIIF